MSKRQTQEKKNEILLQIREIIHIFADYETVK